MPPLAAQDIGRLEFSKPLAVGLHLTHSPARRAPLYLRGAAQSPARGGFLNHGRLHRTSLTTFSPPNEKAVVAADEEQMRFYPCPKTRDEASSWISRNLALYKEYGFGFWLIESLPTSSLIG